MLVLGHRGCGAVKAAMNANPTPGQISALYRPPCRNLLGGKARTYDPLIQSGPSK